MQFKLLSALAFVGAVWASPVLEERQAGFCPEAGRFGLLTLTPSTVSPGQVGVSLITCMLYAVF